jgi:hypothetical protein
MSRNSRPEAGHRTVEVRVSGNDPDQTEMRMDIIIVRRINRQNFWSHKRNHHVCGTLSRGEPFFLRFADQPPSLTRSSQPSCASFFRM